MIGATGASSQTWLRGIDFPATKLEVIAVAEANGAPQEAIESLQRVKCEQFRSAQAVAAALLTDDRSRRVQPMSFARQVRAAETP